MIDIIPGDEDDNDFADVFTRSFDFALVKELADGQGRVVLPGQEVTFTLTIINQGEIPGDSILIVDYIPSNAILVDPLWTDIGGGKATRLIEIGDELTAPLRLIWSKYSSRYYLS